MQGRVTPFLVAAVLWSMPAAAQQTAVVSSEAQGRADRLTFEGWISTLGVDLRKGADFWVQERSKPKAVSCLAAEGNPTPEFISGCQEAQQRLALPDVRRRTEPEYRKGWNADVAIAAVGRPETSIANAPPRSNSSTSECDKASTEASTIATTMDLQMKTNMIRIQSGALDPRDPETNKMLGRLVDGSMARISSTLRANCKAGDTISLTFPRHVKEFCDLSKSVINSGKLTICAMK